MNFNLDALEALSPNFWILIAHLISFAIIIIIIIAFAWKPTKKYLEERKKIINQDIEDAKQKTKEASNLFDQAAQKVNESKIQAEKIHEAAEEKAHNHFDNMVKKAKISAESVVAKAQKDIDKMEIEFEQNKRNEIAKVALLAAEELIRKNINEKDNQKLIDDVIEEIEKND